MSNYEIDFPDSGGATCRASMVVWTDGPVPYYTAEHDLTTLNEFKERLLDRIVFRRICGLSE